jgi:dienelactone hydrolase
MPVDPRQQFLASIHERHRQLRAGDTLPETIEAWHAHKAMLRRKLVESWGGFPPEPCDLAPRKLGELTRDGYRVEKIVFQTRPGVLMTANAYVPAGEGRRPAVLCVHGHWKGAKQDPVPQSRCIGLARLGFFVLAVDAFGAGERGIGKALGEYHGEMVGSMLLPTGLPLSGLQVYENMRAVDYLLTRPEVDGTKLGITGASGGGNQTMYAGAFDERFRCVVPVCSVGTYRSYLGAACCVCELVPGVMTYTEEWALLAMVAPRALMVINATKDAYQFSVGEAQKSIAMAQHVFRLHGLAGNVAHTIFESGHDYGKTMREAMYGWMTLHLKGEGQGNPIPEPPLVVEEPEALRCFPGESRPDDFVTVPRFAEREMARLIAHHDQELPTHVEQWKNTAMRLRHAFEQALGGLPDIEAPRVIENVGGGVALLETEPGIAVRVVSRAPARGMAPRAVIVDLDGADRLFESELGKAFHTAGWNVTGADLRTTGIFAPPGDTIARAPDHNSAEWGMWVGRPLLGQWIHDVRSVVRHLMREIPREGPGITLVGVGAGALVALGAAIFEKRIMRVVLVDPLVSFRGDAPVVGQRMGLFVPGLVRNAGDVPHLASLAAPARLMIAGGVDGAGTAVGREGLGKLFAFTRGVYRMLEIDGHLDLVDAQTPRALIERLSK